MWAEVTIKWVELAIMHNWQFISSLIKIHHFRAHYQITNDKILNTLYLALPLPSLSFSNIFILDCFVLITTFLYMTILITWLYEITTLMFTKLPFPLIISKNRDMNVIYYLVRSTNNLKMRIERKTYQDNENGDVA